LNKFWIRSQAATVFFHQVVKVEPDYGLFQAIRARFDAVFFIVGWEYAILGLDGHVLKMEIVVSRFFEVFVLLFLLAI
jgi:hypothetical protein